MAMPAVGAYGRGPFLWQPARFALRKWWLRTDVGVVHLQLHGILSGMSVVEYLQYRVARIACRHDNTVERKADSSDDKELVDEGPVRE